MNLRSMIESTEVTTLIQEGLVKKADLFSNFTLVVMSLTWSWNCTKKVRKILRWYAEPIQIKIKYLRRQRRKKNSNSCRKENELQLLGWICRVIWCETRECRTKEQTSSPPHLKGIYITAQKLGRTGRGIKTKRSTLHVCRVRPHFQPKLLIAM